MNEIIYKGLKLKSKCNYFQVIEGNVDSVVEDVQISKLTLTYCSGSTNKTLSKSLGLESVGESIELVSTNTPKKFTSSIISLNGLKLKKLTYDPHTLNIIIVSDSESRVVQNYHYTTIVISEKDSIDQEFIDYVFYSGNLLFLKPYGPKLKCYEVRNFPKIILKDSIELVSESTTVYNLRKKYDDYVIRAIDYQDQVIIELRRILEEYGVELVRLNKERTLETTSHVTYQFSQTPVKTNHPKYLDKDSTIMQHKVPIEFSLRTPDMVLYFDFKNKYNNVNLLTNFCEFKTTDKYGYRWSAAIKWGQITEDFNHIYQQDDNSNFGNQCQFRCELYFYEVLDERYKFLEEILYNLEEK